MTEDLKILALEMQRRGIPPRYFAAQMRRGMSPQEIFAAWPKRPPSERIGNAQLPPASGGGDIWWLAAGDGDSDGALIDCHALSSVRVRGAPERDRHVYMALAAQLHQP